jgi:hypothetical protein
MDEDNYFNYTCFGVGMSGGCGVTCPVFVRGDCVNACDASRQEIIDEYGEEESADIMAYYSCFRTNEHHEAHYG